MHGRLLVPYSTWKKAALAAALLALPGMLAACSVPLGPALATSLATAGVQSDNTHVQPRPQPLPQPGPQTGSSALDLSSLQSDLEAYLSRQDGTYGVYVLDLASGQGAGYSPDEVFPAASTFKLPMALHILDLASRGQANLDEKLAYRSADYEEGTGSLQGSIKPGDTYSVRRLIELAITQSDNIATNMLLRRYGRNNVYAFMQKLGGKVTKFNSITNGTTPREMALYMQATQSASVISNPALRQFLMDALERTVFTDRIAAGVPDGVPVAHKIGTLGGVVNDIGMVFAPRRTFIVSVFSMDVNEDVAPSVIAEVTRRVYAFESRQAHQGPAR